MNRMNLPQPDAPLRILFVANAMIPTLQLSFLKPLAAPVAAGRIVTQFLTDEQLREAMGKRRQRAEGKAWFTEKVRAARPDLIVCSRYSGAHPSVLREYADEAGIPLIFHVDDDLLNIPREIGLKKFEMHNSPGRLATVRTLLEQADLVYCSTPAMEDRFRALGFRTPMVHGPIYCASRVRRQPVLGPVRKIGYMGFDHAHDFEITCPSIERILETRPEITFELFGSIPMPDNLARFGDRVSVVEPVRDYALFLQALADREWDIGIAPLARTAFNVVKANTKWVEYTASGMAVVASVGLVYDHCMRDGAGLLVHNDEWDAGLDMLIKDPELRFAMVETAQRRLLTDFSESRLRAQVLDVFAQAFAIVADKIETPPLAAFVRTAT